MELNSRMTASDSRDLPPLPQDPPTTHATIGSPVDSNNGTASVTDTESYSRRSKIRTRSRSSRESWIHEEISRTYKKLQYQLQDERRRADDAERKLVEVTAHLKTVNDARLIAMQDAAQAKEDLRLYKIQLDRAQKEIYRAQETITVVDQQRHAAEKEAAKNRSKARQLNETLLVQAAREEAWRLGLQEGLNQGRNIALAAEPTDVPYTTANPPLDDTSYSEESRSSVAQTQSQFPIRTQSPVSPHSRGPESRQARSPSIIIPLPPGSATQPNSPQPSAGRPLSTHASDIPDRIRPRSVHNVAPSPRLPRSNLPIPDNLIPSLDSDNRIRIPAPFEFSRTPEPAPSIQLPRSSNASQEALPIPPPIQPSASQHHRRPGHRRNSSSGSSSLSALDIINEPFGGNLRTPMSVIPEVLSQYTGSPLPRSIDGEHDMRHQPSLHDSFHQPPPRSHSPAGSYRISEGASRHRPTSRSSFITSHMNPSQELSNSSTPPGIDVQPPSHPPSHRTSQASESPASRYHVPVPNGPSGFSRPSSIMTSHTIPGGLTNVYGTTSHQYHPVQRDLHFETTTSSSSRQNRRQSPSELHSAVSSALTADTLTTPPTMYRTLRQDGIEPSGSRRTSRAGSPSLRRSSGIIPTSPVNTDVPPHSAAATDDMTGIGTAKKGKKGKRK